MPMKLNISNPAQGQQKTFEIQDDHKLMPFFEKRMGAEVLGDSLGDEFKGYLFKIAGGNDKQGFPMKQGVLRPDRVRILFSKGMSCYRERRKGMRKRKSVRGCIVGQDLSILNLCILRKGDADIEGLTNGVAEKRKGPKRATRIRKLFNLEKADDVRRYVIRRTINDKKKKAAKIQRLITAERLQRKRFFKSQRRKKIQANREERTKYEVRLHEYRAQKKEKRQAEVAKKKASKKKAGATVQVAAKKAEQAVRKGNKKK